MGCGAAKATAATAPDGEAPEEKPEVADTPTESSPDNGKPVAKPVAFEIPVLDEQSIIKKHPPKRLQVLEEQAATLTVSTDKIEEKQTKAEERRLEILQERVNNAQKFQQRMGQPNRNEDDPSLPNGVDQEEEVPA